MSFFEGDIVLHKPSGVHLRLKGIGRDPPPPSQGPARLEPAKAEMA
jgi:hypothetical protein